MNGRFVTLTIAAGLAVTSVAVGANLVSGADASDETVFVPITPCRLIDTRPGTNNVGPRDTKIGENESALFTAWGTGDADSPCDVPNSATAVATNAVAIAPTARGFMTLYPGDVANPGTANLNFVADQAPTPNAANIPLSATGTFNIFNAFGQVHAVIDVNGYYQPSSAVGATGPAGADGTDGPAGADGTDGTDGPVGPAGPVNCLSDELIQAERWDLDPCRQASFATGIVPASGAASMAAANGKLYIVDETAAAVEVFDAETGAAVTTISGVTAPRDIAYDGSRLYVVNHPSGPSPQTITVQVIDPATDALVGTPISVGTSLGAGGTAARIVNAPGEMYVAHTGGPIAVIDTATNVVTTTSVDPGGPVTGLVSTGSRVYVTEVVFGGLSFIDTTTKTGGATALSNLGELVFSGRYIFGVTGSNIRVIDPATDTEIAGSPIGLGDNISSLAYDGTFIYAASPGVGIVAVMRAANLVLEQPIPTTADAGTITYDGKNIFVLDLATGVVTKLHPF